MLHVSYTASTIGGLEMNNLVFVDTNIDIGSTPTSMNQLANVTGAASITYWAIAFQTPITILVLWLWVQEQLLLIYQEDLLLL